MTDETNTFRPIDGSDYPPPATPSDYGAAPMLQWVKIADLVVDEGYQRPIYGGGVSNVKRIAARFRWSKFAPIVVSPVPGGKFAVVDGQHRATAAHTLGFDAVPAQVIIADAAEQAEAFGAINGAVTKVHRLVLHHAAIKAGDPSAMAIDAAVQAAGAEIVRSPRQNSRLLPGQTQALGAIKDGLDTFGEEAVITALQCVTETTNNKPGGLAADHIRALCAVLAENHRWRDAGEALLQAFDGIDLEFEFQEALITRRPKGTATWQVLADRLRERLRTLLP